jgi:hypothetical protein
MAINFIKTSEYFLNLSFNPQTYIGDAHSFTIEFWCVIPSANSGTHYVLLGEDIADGSHRFLFYNGGDFYTWSCGNYYGENVVNYAVTRDV